MDIWIGSTGSLEPWRKSTVVSRKIVWGCHNVGRDVGSRLATRPKSQSVQEAEGTQTRVEVST
jgi:hypothetical protein